MYSDREHEKALGKLASDMALAKDHATIHATPGAKLPPVSLDHTNIDSGLGLPLKTRSEAYKALLDTLTDPRQIMAAAEFSIATIQDRLDAVNAAISAMSESKRDTTGRVDLTKYVPISRDPFVGSRCDQTEEVRIELTLPVCVRVDLDRTDDNGRPCWDFVGSFVDPEELAIELRTALDGAEDELYELAAEEAGEAGDVES